MNFHTLYRAVCFSFSALLLIPASLAGIYSGEEDRIRPYDKNPNYWQYEGHPVLLVGGSKTDHIFLLDDLATHLEEIAHSGANYVRCVMSQREGKDLKPHLLREDQKFDLNQWSKDYWDRFAECLRICEELRIIVQIEVWDRFDYSREQWTGSAWRPANNINYDGDDTGFSEDYPQPAHRGDHPYFHTLPGSPKYERRFELIRQYQELLRLKDVGHKSPVQ